MRRHDRLEAPVMLQFVEQEQHASLASTRDKSLVDPTHVAAGGRIRGLALSDQVIDSELRGCDLVQLRIGAVVINGAARHRATIIQQKTGKPVQFELMEQNPREPDRFARPWRGTRIVLLRVTQIS